MKKSLSEIEAEFRTIADANQLVGDSVEVLIKLLSYNRYESLTSVDNVLLESLPDNAVNTNSKIAHAMNEMYSIYRGKNATVVVNALVTGNVKLGKYSKIYSDRDNTLYFLSASLDGIEVDGDYQFTYGKTYQITLLKAEKKLTEVVTVSEGNKYLIELLDTDISETYSIRTGSNLEVVIPTTKDFGKHLDSSIQDNVENLAFDLTIPDYGLRLYAPNSDGFNSSLTYTIDYFKYLDTAIDINNLQKLKITGFQLDIDSMIVYQRIPKETESNFLYNLKKNAIVQSRVRTNSDLIDLFKNMFTGNIKDASMQPYDLVNDIITINYIPLVSTPLDPGDINPTDIDPVELESYIQSLMYYVTPNIEVRPRRDSDATNLKIELFISVYEAIDPLEIFKIVESYEYKLGNDFSRDRFVGEVNDISGVRYCSVVCSIINPDNSETIVTKFQNDIDSYFLISPNLSYTYKR